MQVKNSKIGRYRTKKVLKCFVNDLTALQTSNIEGLNRNTVNRFYLLFRKLIFEYQSKLFKDFKMRGEIEVDESYFGARRIRGFKGKLKRGRGTRKKPLNKLPL